MTMFKTLASALAMTVAAGAATAQVAPQDVLNPGDVQLALEAGVAPGALDRVSLIQLLDAQRANDDARIAFILERAGTPAENVGISTMGEMAGEMALPPGVTPGQAQMAATLGVDPTHFTMHELIAMWPSGDN